MTIKAEMEGLAGRHSKALDHFDEQWVAGPTLPDDALDAIKSLEAAGLLERRFADQGPPVRTVGERSLTVRLSACWHFRLTQLGARARNSGEGVE